MQMKDGTYSVHTNEYEFAMTVNEYKGIYKIKYGDPHNREGPCVEFTYDVRKPTRLKLDNLEYKNTCSRDVHLRRGEGTIHMLKSALLLICKKFVDIKRVYLNDVATIHCNGHNLLLAYLYILCYGHTWYSKHFGAKPSDKLIKEELASINKKLYSKGSI